MNRICSTLAIIFGVVGLLAIAAPATAQNTASTQPDQQPGQPAPVSVAVLPFTYSGEDLKDIAAELPTLLTAMLSSELSLLLVERAEVDKALTAR